ncbi:kinase-like protein [Athelia psychrophila]|uniref:Kinase-like protein n=1 Tax=Athelia psychrophila TaxID=1759441 RepID=A0A165YVY8_9AGAM|nr:kinase-like protein [Fibularhizoctonia sp. CBS 109695]
MTTCRVPNLNGRIRKRSSPLALNVPSRVDLSLNTYGGFGDILIGEYDDVGKITRTVAVKVLRPHSRHNGQRRETKLWECLCHPNIVPLLGLTTDFGRYKPNLPGMVSPWMRNGNLIDYVKPERRNLHIAQLLKLLCDIATGLAYLHSSKIIHGDLTPTNVLIDDNYNACLTDFGLSTLAGGLEGTSYWTATIGGAMRWRAPELLPAIDYPPTTLFVPSLTTQCDIYSYGQIVLQIISGELPYFDIKNVDCITMELFKRNKPHRPLHPRLTDEYWGLANKCWGQSPDTRPSAEEVIQLVSSMHCEALKRMARPCL